jgi:hypothetical protein
MGQSSRFHKGLFFLIAGIFLLFGCAGTKVVEVEYYDFQKPGPPYTSREKPAEWLQDEDTAPLLGAQSIGKILIQASKQENAVKVAPVEAAKFGADFYIVDYKSSHVTGKGSKIDRYSYTRGSKTDYGGRKTITETTITSVDRDLKGWWCDLYRVNPDPKERDRILKWGFYYCGQKCKGLVGVYSACSPVTLKKYLAKGLDPNPDFFGIPLLYSFVNCIATPGGFDDFPYNANYEKLRMLLDAGTDPNMPIKKDISEDLKHYPVLKNYRKPYPSVLKIVRDTIADRIKKLAKLEQEPRKKREYDEVKNYLDFLKRIEALLIQKGARIQ